jgi:hypothetical protein
LGREAKKRWKTFAPYYWWGHEFFKLICPNAF